MLVLFLFGRRRKVSKGFEDYILGGKSYYSCIDDEIENFDVMVEMVYFDLNCILYVIGSVNRFGLFRKMLGFLGGNEEVIID